MTSVQAMKKVAKKIIGGAIETIMVRVDSLVPHPIAQRSIEESHVKNIRATLDLDAIGVIHVVRIKGRLYIVDGQHRYRALMDEGCGEWLVEVRVHLDVADDTGAAKLFLKLNYRRKINPFDTFDKEVVAGDPVALGVVKVLDGAGIKVARYATDGAVNCVGALKKVYSYKKGESLGDVLRITLKVCSAAYGTGESVLEGKLLEGVGMAIAAHYGNIETDDLVKKLSKRGSAASLIGDAKGLRDYQKSTLARAVADVVIDTYNSGKRENNKLDRV